MFGNLVKVIHVQFIRNELFQRKPNLSVYLFKRDNILYLYGVSTTAVGVDVEGL